MRLAWNAALGLIVSQIISILTYTLELYQRTSNQYRLLPKMTMSRLLSAALLFVIALPVSAQDDAAYRRPLISRADAPSAILLQTKTELTQKLQQIQQMLSVVSPGDTQFIETLKTQQAELTKQLRDVMQQLQTPDAPNTAELPPGLTVDSAMVPGMLPTRIAESGLPPVIPVHPSPMPAKRNEVPFPTPNYSMPVYVPTPVYNPNPAYFPPNGHDQDRAWEIPPWGPRLPKELTEMKQSIESLQKEIGDLKETIKALEAQIQLLNRNIVLSEKVRESGN